MTLTKALAVSVLVTGFAIPMHTTCVHAGESPQIVKVTANKFHFTPDRITLVKGQPVTLQLTSTDVTHGFMQRALGIDAQIKPGKTMDVTVTPATAGTFKVICDHYCGLGHGGMKMTVVVKDAMAKASPETWLPPRDRRCNSCRSGAVSE
jgi:cytochrome c oxidase subunit 2